jgi:competence protein ComEA
MQFYAMSAPSPAPARDALLRRTDQAAVAVLVVIAFLAMIGWWCSRGGAHGRWIEAERVDPQTVHFVVDVNTAEEPELIQLPGIGPTLARRIIETREASGPFLRPDDLRRVKGIGEKKTAQLRPYVQTSPVAGADSGWPR